MSNTAGNSKEGGGPEARRQPREGSLAPALASFEYLPRTRVVFGVNAVQRVGDLARELGARCVLVVTDPGIVTAGHADHVEHILQSCGLGVVVFDDVHENPTTRDVDRCLQVARSAGIDTIIGLGGGSSLDTAKGCNFVLTNGGRLQDYWGAGKATKPMLPLIAIPTTAGTGSECQSAALIADERTHQKMACLDPKAAARVALLDPALTVSQPPRVTALTGIDAMAHAVESAVTRKRNPVSLMFARESFRLTVPGLPQVISHPNDLPARGRMLLGAAFAGTASSNAALNTTGTSDARLRPAPAGRQLIVLLTFDEAWPAPAGDGARVTSSTAQEAAPARAHRPRDLRADDRAVRVVHRRERGAGLRRQTLAPRCHTAFVRMDVGLRRRRHSSGTAGGRWSTGPVLRQRTA